MSGESSERAGAECSSKGGDYTAKIKFHMCGGFVISACVDLMRAMIYRFGKSLRRIAP
jgi:hypothetical protein